MKWISAHYVYCCDNLADLITKLETILFSWNNLRQILLAVIHVIGLPAMPLRLVQCMFHPDDFPLPNMIHSLYSIAVAFQTCTHSHKRGMPCHYPFKNAIINQNFMGFNEIWQRKTKSTFQRMYVSNVIQ